MAAPPSRTVQRIERELNDLQQSPLEFVNNLEIVDDNHYEWKGKMMGPPDTPYAGKTFEFKISYPQRTILYERPHTASFLALPHHRMNDSKQYPLKAPTFKFKTQIDHPNIHPDGTLSLGLLQGEWTARTSMRTILQGVYSLLVFPDHNTPITQ
ncbi:unnamed protein product, partial [Didymodactylos carnosus]